jgi:ABC-type sugar transport system substrate-binding protein
MPSPEGFGYEEAFVGPDDWGQSRALADRLAEAANYEGGYCIMTHNAGTSAYYARLYGVLTEMAKVAPNMTLLDVQTPGFDAEKVKSTVSSWITKYGDELNVIALSETTGQAIGSIEACEAADRTDIIIGGIDNSKTALEYVQGGELEAATNQPPMQDGALAVLTAAKWLAGEEVAPITFMAPSVITIENVENYLPAQW